MKRFLTILVLFGICATGLSQNKDKDGLPSFIFKCQGLERTYYLHMPEGLPEGAPLVMFLHGYGSKHPREKAFCALADKEKFAVCIPWAAEDTNGQHGWNVGYNMQKGYKIDDVRFIIKLSKYLQKKHHLSKENVFLSGVSNGGEMCYLTAYRKPEFFKAMGSISGLTMKWMYDSLKPAKPVPFMELHGTEDRVSEWSGQLDDDYWGPYIAVPIAVSNWAIAARCDHEITEEIPPVTDSSHKVIAHKYVSDTNGGVQVQLYEIIGGGHGVSKKDLDYPTVIWEFFKQYIK